MKRLPTSNHEIFYRKKPGERWFAGFATLFIGAMFGAFDFLLLPMVLRSSPGHSPLENLSFAILIVPMALFGLFMVGLAIYGIGPEDLILDLTARTYRFRRGWPLLAHWQTGSFGDIASLSIKRWQNKSVTRYQVLLHWNGMGSQTLAPIGDGALKTRKSMLLANCKTEDEARASAQALAEECGIALDAGNSPFDAAKKKQEQKLLYLILSVFIVIFLGMTGLPLVLQHQLDTDGRTAPGQIVERSFHKHARVYFNYSVNGQMLRGDDEVRRDDYEQLTIGSPVMVTYLPSYPLTCRITESNKRRGDWTTLIVYGGWIIIGCIWKGIKYYKKKRRAQQSGA